MGSVTSVIEFGFKTNKEKELLTIDFPYKQVM